MFNQLTACISLVLIACLVVSGGLVEARKKLDLDFRTPEEVIPEQVPDLIREALASPEGGNKYLLEIGLSFSEFSEAKCGIAKLKEFVSLKSEISHRNPSLLEPYVEFCEDKQLDLCKRKFVEQVALAASKLSPEVRQDAALLLEKFHLRNRIPLLWEQIPRNFLEFLVRDSKESLTRKFLEFMKDKKALPMSNVLSGREEKYEAFEKAFKNTFSFCEVMWNEFGELFEYYDYLFKRIAFVNLDKDTTTLLQQARVCKSTLGWSIPYRAFVSYYNLPY